MKKLGFLILALVLVMGTMGVGYSMWTQTIKVNGTVSTGNVSWEFVPTETSLDPGPNYTGYGGNVYAGSLDWTIANGMNPTTIQQLTKNIGWTDVTQVDSQHLNVTLNNVYPGYYNDIDMHFYNNGTIPIKTFQPTLTYTDPTTGLPVTILVPAGTVVEIPGNDQYGGVSDVIEVRWMANLTGVQWDPGQEAEVSWGIHILEAAKQNSNYTFTFSDEAVNWNEYPSS
jgi:hypothetical protein